MNTKNTISTWLRRSAIKLGLMTMAITLFAAPAAGQTAENDVIENIASVTYEDANGNSYTKADTLQLTVGFKAGIATTPDGTTVTPASPSTGNEQTFTITNNGNGTDSVTVAASSDDTNVAAITGYKYNGTTYATLTLLNQALAGVAITAGNSIDVIVIYDVPARQRGIRRRNRHRRSSPHGNGRRDARRQAR